MTDQLAGGVAKLVDVVVRPLTSALVYALPLVYVAVVVVVIYVYCLLCNVILRLS